MALVYRAGSFVSAGNASGGDLVINKPTGGVEGDIFITVVYWEPDTTTISTVPSGWTRAATIANTGAFLIEVWYKRAGASEPATYTWGNSTAGNQWRSIVSAAYSGGTGTGSLIDVISSAQADAAPPASQTAPSVTTTGANRMLVYGYGCFSGTEPDGVLGAASNLRGSLGGTALSDALFASAGATGTTRITGPGATETYAAMHVAIISDTGGGAVGGYVPPHWTHRIQRFLRHGSGAARRRVA